MAAMRPTRMEVGGMTPGMETGARVPRVVLCKYRND
jgi:hypothetical protein